MDDAPTGRTPDISVAASQPVRAALAGAGTRLAEPVRSFHPNRMPAMTRHNYRRELAAAFFMPWAIAATEGGVVAFIVLRLFEGVVGDELLAFTAALVGAAPALANITSFFWTRLAHGRDKVKVINALQLMLLTLIAVIALSPRSPLGLLQLVLAAVAARMCLSGLVTIRSTVWGANYPDAHRARMTGKFTTVQVILGATMATSVGLAMQLNEQSFRFILPVAGMVSLIGVWNYSRVRVRRRRVLKLTERAAPAEVRPAFNPLALWTVLRDDPLYRRYMTWQFALGFGNMMSWVAFVMMAEGQFTMGYLPGLIVTQALPMLMMPAFIPGWAKLLDRVHITTFRAVHSWVFVAMLLAAFLGGQMHITVLLFVSAAIKGIAFGGGSLAWTLGHLHFAKPDRASQYMSVHVTLTGVRGLIAPFCGVALYRYFETHTSGGGSWVFLVCAGITMIAAIGFYRLHKGMGEVAGAG